MTTTVLSNNQNISNGGYTTTTTTTTRTTGIITPSIPVTTIDAMQQTRLVQQGRYTVGDVIANPMGDGMSYRVVNIQQANSINYIQGDNRQQRVQVYNTSPSSNQGFQSCFLTIKLQHPTINEKIFQQMQHLLCKIKFRTNQVENNL
jgi:hypothetical protein